MFGWTRLAGRLAAVGAAIVVGGACLAGCTSSPAASSAGSSPTRASTSAPASAGSSASSAAASPTTGATSAAASQRAASASGTASSAASASPASSSGTGGSAAGGAGTAGCASIDLGAHVGLAQGTAGSTYQVIYFTNLATTPCTLYGYPGVALAGGSSQVDQVGPAAVRTPAIIAAHLVTLAPGQSARFVLRIVEAGNYPTRTCQPTATTFLQIYPPNQTTPIYLAYKSTGCASPTVNLLSVSAMTAGTGG